MNYGVYHLKFKLFVFIFVQFLLNFQFKFFIIYEEKNMSIHSIKKTAGFFFVVFKPEIKTDSLWSIKF